jgi:aromatic ring hydroxylase
MAVRTGAQFIAGLRDGREVWINGERVKDVTRHPQLRNLGTKRRNHVYGNSTVGISDR